MWGIERTNAFIREKGFDFEISSGDLTGEWKTFYSGDRKVWFKGRLAGELITIWFGDWRNAEDKHKFSTKDTGELSGAEQRTLKKLDREVEELRKAKTLVAKAQVEELMGRWSRVQEPSDYLLRKNLGTVTPGPAFVRLGEEDAQRILVVPMFDAEGELWNFQQLYRSGIKTFHPNARAKGLFHTIEGNKDVVLIGEGYATCLAAWRASGFETIVGFSAGNLERVLQATLTRHDAARIILLGDWDGETFAKPNVRENPGMLACQKLALKYGVKVASPIEPVEGGDENIDFADLSAASIIERLSDQNLLTRERLSTMIFKEKREKAQKDKKPSEPESSGGLSAGPPSPPAADDVKKTSSDGDPGPRGFEKPLDVWLRAAPAEAPRLAPVNTDPDRADFPSMADGFFDRVQTKQGDRFVPNYEEFSRYVGMRYFLKTNDAFSYLYEDGHYRQASMLQLKNMAQRLIKENTAPSQISAFVEHARAVNFIRADELREPRGMINLKNGILDVRTKQLREHSPEFFFKYRLPHEYVEGAKCPNWLAFLERTFEGNKELVDVCAEIFGYVLLGGEPFLHKAFVLSGEGRNGKSTFLDVMKYMIGRSNFSSIPVGQLERPFSAIMADGMLANIVGETSAKEINSETFKTAVGGEELIAAQKGCPEYAMPFHARIVMACNRLPHLGDATTGAHEKFFILPFNRYLQKTEREALFAQRHLFPEISGIICWALEGLERLVRRGMLPEISAVEGQTVELREEIDSVYAWFKEFVTIGSGEDVSLTNVVQFKKFYSHYKIWCDAEGRNPVAALTFSKRCLSEVRKFPHLKITRPGNVQTVTGDVAVAAKALTGADLPY